MERFTDRSRLVIQQASHEADRLGHAYIGPEHVLLAIARQNTGVATTILKNLGANLAAVIQEIENNLDTAVAADKTRAPTASLADIARWASEESVQLGHDYVGTEHILLALLRDEQGTSVKVLNRVGMDVVRVRRSLALGQIE